MAGVVVTLYITDSTAWSVDITQLSKESERKTIQYCRLLIGKCE
jgi:hypothetical protein